ncbi:MAG: hypothetical protein DWQ10_12865 [Calditrichaeota bacterium]|nr:MAG: hypothetical protein DWQ10_12865 [Calditrichota bacterium]
MPNSHFKTHLKNNTEDGYVLGLVLVFFLIFSMIGLTLLKMAGDESVFAANYYHKVKAFYLAEQGIQRGVWLVNNVSSDAATYSNENVDVKFDENELTLTATGYSGQVQKTIRATLEGGSSVAWPYVLYSDSYGIEITNGYGQISGDIHSNSSIKILNHKHDGNQTVAPPTVPPPDIDWDYYKKRAIEQGHYSKSYIILSPGWNSGSGIWYGEGPVYLWNYPDFEGTIISKGMVYIFGNNSTITAQSGYPAIITKDYLYINGTNIKINGLICNASNNENKPTWLNSNGLKITGAVLSTAPIRKNNTGETTITYDENILSDIQGIEINGQGTTGAEVQISYWEELH